MKKTGRNIIFSWVLIVVFISGIAVSLYCLYSTSKAEKKKLGINSLKDGTYNITGELLKTDMKSKSMSDSAISHNILLTVKKGKYKLTINFSGMAIGNSQGYLGKLEYFKTGYKKDKNGVPSGKKKAVSVKAYQKDSSGKKLSDSYGTDYPAKVTFPLIPEAKKDGYVPLQVFVPLMETISAGSGNQPVYLKLDLSSVTVSRKSTKGSPLIAVSAAKNTEKGTIYSCQVVPSYKHPLTGQAEDSAGESSYATGQGMAESAILDSGMLEETEEGMYYLTLRLSLMDFASGHKFWTQEEGETIWKQVSPVVTQNGSDNTGKTSDFCFPVPGRESIIKISMYVEPMGRDVVFYASLKNIEEGKPEDMEALMVSGNTKIDEMLSSAQGLSLSTEAGNEQESTGKDAALTANGSNGMSFLKWTMVFTISLTVSGLLLITAVSGTVYYFHLNWRRWGEGMEDDKD